jgi:hypothetical protein
MLSCYLNPNFKLETMLRKKIFNAHAKLKTKKCLTNSKENTFG